MDKEPTFPIPISAIDGKYLVFDIQAITWLRKHHQICGVFIGTLPQNPSQNIFLGLPMQIMPEEAQLLIELGIGYILDDARAHDVALAKANHIRQRQYMIEVRREASEISEAKAREKEAERRRKLKEVKVKGKKSRKESTAPSTATPTNEVERLTAEDGASDSIFEPPDDPQPASIASCSPSTSITRVDHTLTPTTSTLLLSNSSHLPSQASSNPPSWLPGLKPASYYLYRHLHLTRPATYFAHPGLRFGCQFCIYPGDPLRFHSHFLGVGVDWEEEMDLMDIVGGGRLGTGVKKGWLFGGREPGGEGEEGKVRTFSVEWAAM